VPRTVVKDYWLGCIVCGREHQGDLTYGNKNPGCQRAWDKASPETRLDWTRRRHDYRTGRIQPVSGSPS
jgi:hypothetical protein